MRISISNSDETMDFYFMKFISCLNVHLFLIEIYRQQYRLKPVLPTMVRERRRGLTVLKPSLNVISRSMLETAIDVKSAVVVINPAELKDIDFTDYCRNYIIPDCLKFRFLKKYHYSALTYGVYCKRTWCCRTCKTKGK